MTTFYRRLPGFGYLRPKTLDEALSLLSEHGEGAKLLAGGTDLIPQIKRREMGVPRYVVDLKGIPGLAALTHDRKGGLFIGPLTTIGAIENSDMVRAHFNPLVQAAANMASPQVRNRGTFAGNICSAVPSADSAPALLTLNASVKLKNLKGERVVPLDDFFTGPRKTVIDPDEVLVGITVPKMAPGSRGVYLKLSPRRSMDLAVVGVAALALCRDGVCKAVRIALGAVAPTPARARRAEEILLGKSLSKALIEEAALNASTECRPIDDHRGSAEYRCDMVYAMTRRALQQLFFPEGDI